MDRDLGAPMLRAAGLLVWLYHASPHLHIDPYSFGVVVHGHITTDRGPADMGMVIKTTP